MTVAPDPLVASVDTFDGVPASAGPVVSRTVTVNDPVAVLPAASVAEQLTVVVPSGNVEPEGGVHVTTGFAGFASVAVAVKVVTAPDGPCASTVVFAGRFSVGGVVSHETTFAVTGSDCVRVIAVLFTFVPDAV